MPPIKDLVCRIISFVQTDIWRFRLKDIPPAKAFCIRQLRVVLLAIRRFKEDKCPLRAAALTFYSVLSIVPVAAMAFGIAKGFGFEKILERRLYENFPGQEEVLVQVISFSHSLLENTKGGVIAGFGLVVLFWTVTKVLGHIEHSLNDIWEIKESRTYWRKFSDYLSLILICPFLLIMSSSTTVFITTQITLITEKVALLGVFSPFIFFTLKFLPYCLIWTLFTFSYILIPNTSVRFSSGLWAGVIAGTSYQIAQRAYIYFQVGVANYNAIYGSFAALPLFLVWLKLSWLIVLFGAEISFAHQNVDTYEFEPDCLRISRAFKNLLSLQIAHLLIKNFSEGKKPLTAREISRTLEIPIRLVRKILTDLVDSGLISSAQTRENAESSYQPALDINRLSIQFIIEALDHRGVEDIPVAQTTVSKKLVETLQSFGDTIQKSPANRLLREI